jgi:hypothetical protein
LAQTENKPLQDKLSMEVHHHSHEEHGKKTWKSYIKEFFMLFFAVFCGSLAEYQLEHKIENDREKVYIKSMIEDLKTDDIKLDSSIVAFTNQEKNFDTIYSLFPKLSKGYNHSLRSSLKRIVGYKDFFPTDKTMQQLKNSGGMRLIQSKIAADGITDYDLKIKEYNKSLDNLEGFFLKMIDSKMEIEDIQSLELALLNNTASVLEKGNKNYLLNANDDKIGLYYNKIKMYHLLRKVVLKRMKTIKKEGSQLSLKLKNEYDLN